MKRFVNRKLPLSILVVLPFLVQILVFVGLTGYFSWQSGQKAVQNISNHLRDQASQRIIEHLNRYLSKPQDIIQTTKDAFSGNLLAQDDLPKIGRFFWKQMQFNKNNLSYINYGLVDGSYAGAGYLENQKEITISETSLRTEGLSYSYATDEAGNRISLSTVYPDYDYKQESWYRETVNSGKSGWCSVYLWNADTVNISIAACSPIYARSGKIIGAIGVDVLLANISNFLSTIEITQTATTFIMERDGALIATSGKTSPTTMVNGKAARLLGIDSGDPYIKETTKQLLHQFKSFKDLKKPELFDFTLKGERLFVLVKPWQDKHNLDWLVVVVVPEKDFMAAINANTRATVLLCFIALVVAIIFGLVTSHCLIRAIKKTIKAAYAVSEGDWQQTLKDSVFLELSQLASAFNPMAQQIQYSFSRLEYNASHDMLTGLFNQEAFKSELEKILKRHTSNPENLCAVLFLDLDDFKVVNDSLGHLSGDFLLQKVTIIILNCVRQGDLVARFGGDEFVILLKDIKHQNEAIKIADCLCEELKTPFDLCGREVFIGASIGIVFDDENLKKPEDFLRNADIALYRAKASGKGSYEIFDQHMHTQVLRRLSLTTDLRKALENQELKIYYQPIFDAKSHQFVGFEALLKWKHHSLGWIAHEEFMPIAEETGLIVELGWWLAKKACEQLFLWQSTYASYDYITVSLNLSPKQFFQADLMPQLHNIVQESQISTHNLVLAITESVFINNTKLTVTKLRAIRDLGIRLSLNDFGTGYSSLSYIKNFAPEMIKIDRSFLQNLHAKGKNYAIVEAMIILANKLNIKVIAEGVENSQQLSHLMWIGCHQLQGDFFSPPLVSQEAEKFFGQTSEGKIR